jgi:hypothetical protein
MALSTKSWIEPIPTWVVIAVVVIAPFLDPFDSILGNILFASATVSSLLLVAYCARIIQRARQS